MAAMYSLEMTAQVVLSGRAWPVSRFSVDLPALSPHRHGRAGDFEQFLGDTGLANRLADGPESFGMLQHALKSGMHLGFKPATQTG